MALHGRILHIFTHSTVTTEQIEAEVGKMGVSSRQAPDCYAGLAELVREGAEAFDCVVVSLENLSRSDEEFFQIASRRFRSLPVYVYGAESGEITTSWALRVGARGRFDLGVLTDVFEGFGDARPDVREPVAPQPQLTDILVDELVGPIEGDSASSFSARDIASHREQTGKMRHKPTASGAEKENQPAKASGTPPLLSDEELRALLGDDTVIDDDRDAPAEGEEGI